MGSAYGSQLKVRDQLRARAVRLFEQSYLLLVILPVAILSGCANIPDRLNASLVQSFKTAEYCSALAVAFPVEEDELKTRLRNVVKVRLAGRYCEAPKAASGLTPGASVAASVRLPDDCDHSFIDDQLKDLRERVNGMRNNVANASSEAKALEQAEKQIDDFRAEYGKSVLTIETELDSALDDAKELKSCHGLACGRRIAIALSGHSSALRKALGDIKDQAEELQTGMTAWKKAVASVGPKAEDLMQEGAVVALATASVIRSGETMLRDVLADSEVKNALRQYLLSRELYRVGGRLMKAAEAGIAPMDALLQKVDEKAWFAGTLTLVAEEHTINTALDDFSLKVFKPKSGSLEVRAAVARVACDRWMGSLAMDQEVAPSGKQSSLLAPFIYRLFMQVSSDLEQELKEQNRSPSLDFGRNLLLASMDQRANDNALALGLVPADYQATSNAKKKFSELTNPSRSDIAEVALARQAPQNPLGSKLAIAGLARMKSQMVSAPISKAKQKKTSARNDVESVAKLPNSKVVATPEVLATIDKGTLDVIERTARLETRAQIEKQFGLR